MLSNIRQHSFVVARVSEIILKKLHLHGKAQNLPSKDLVTAGALLHDIAKTDCIKTGGDHAKIGSQICQSRGYTKVAEIVREHVWLVDFSLQRYEKGLFLATELIYYADKRVLHDKIVNLSTRLDYILKRYGNNNPARLSLIKKNFLQCQELERWLINFCDCSQEQFLSDIPSQPCGEDEAL